MVSPSVTLTAKDPSKRQVKSKLRPGMVAKKDFGLRVVQTPGRLHWHHPEFPRARHLHSLTAQGQFSRGRCTLQSQLSLAANAA